MIHSQTQRELLACLQEMRPEIQWLRISVARGFRQQWWVRVTARSALERRVMFSFPYQRVEDEGVERACEAIADIAEQMLRE